MKLYQKLRVTFPVVIANILLKTIESLLPDITQRISENGFFIASGIRKDEQFDAAKLIESFGFKFCENVFRKRLDCISF